MRGVIEQVCLRDEHDFPRNLSKTLTVN